jgi:hypothetical protein
MAEQNLYRTDFVEHEARMIDKATPNVASRTASSVDEQSEDGCVDPKEERAFASQTIYNTYLLI